jgi:hypothetical protein
MRFMAMDATKVSPAPFNSTPRTNFWTAEEGLIDIYTADTSYTWGNTLALGPRVSNYQGLSATDLVSSFLMRLTKNYGGDALSQPSGLASLPFRQSLSFPDFYQLSIESL